MAKKSEQVRDELIDMCRQFVTGSTIYNLKGNVTVNGWRSRRTKLIKLGVQIDTFLLPGRGYGTPFYRLLEPLVSAIAKIDAKYGPAEKKPKAVREVKEKEERIDPKDASRWEGKGLETWFFMTHDRCEAYKEWCKPWQK